MAVDIAGYHEELFQEVHGLADADGRFAEDAFFEVFTGALTDSGEIEATDRVYYMSPRGIRVDGYGGDPVCSDGVLSLIISDFSQSQDITTLTATDMNATFRRLSNFLERTWMRHFATASRNRLRYLALLTSSRHAGPLYPGCDCF